jgi:hypothetical protein
MPTGVYSTKHMQALQRVIREYEMSQDQKPAVVCLRENMYINLLDEMKTEYYKIEDYMYKTCITFQGVVVFPDSKILNLLGDYQNYCILKR